MYHVSLDQLSQLSASPCLCLTEPVRLLTALCYCVSTVLAVIKSSWNLPERSVKLICDFLFYISSWLKALTHTVRTIKTLPVTNINRSSCKTASVWACALSKVLKFPPMRPNTKLGAYPCFKEASHFSYRCFISAATSRDQHIDRAHCHKGHFISVMRAAGQESLLWKSERIQYKGLCWQMAFIHVQKIKRTNNIMLASCGHTVWNTLLLLV